MAELCTRKRCVAEIEGIVMDANEKIVLVSPYIKADEDIVERLKRKTEDVDVLIIYGKDKEQPKAKSLLEAAGVSKIFVKDLHSKCYLNENKALVTSMNLYEYSQNNNEEMGVLVSREADEELYESIIELVEHWEAIGERQSPDAPKTRRKKVVSKTQAKSVAVPAKGFCIRCGENAALDPIDLKPYCACCYKKWQRSKQTDAHREKHCHLCGKESKTSLIKPACWGCYKKYKDMVEFEAA